MHSKIKLYFRGRGRAKILPITGADGENSIQQLGHKEAERENPNAYRVYSPNGLSPCLGTMQGGGREPSIAFPCFVDMTIGKGVNLTENARTLCARYQKGMTNHEATTSGIAIKIIGEVNSSQDGKVHDVSGIAKCHSAGHNNSPKIAISCDVKCININNENGKERSQQDRVYDVSGIMTALNSQLGGRRNIAIPVLTPDRAEKRQNGRRFKENGEPMFTLTAQDRHGDGIEVCGFNTMPDGTIRTLKHQYQKNSAANFNMQTSRGASAVCVKINKDISFDLKSFSSKTRGKPERIGYVPTLDHNCYIGVAEKTNIDDKKEKGIYVEMPGGFLTYCVWYEKEQCYITIRKLTPKECFRLQGWTDDYFERAAFVNSDSQLYKQAGNGVTVDVVYAIGKKIKECEEESLEEFAKYMNKPEKGKENDDTKRN